MKIGEGMVQVDASKEKFIRDRVLVYLKKNHDYGDSFVNSLDTHGDIAFVVRAEDKISRVASLIKTGKSEVRDESMRDTVLDLFNYTAMFRAWKCELRTLQGILDCMYDLTDLSLLIEVLEDAGVQMSDGVAASIMLLLEKEIT
jgi:hypothetical protein